MDSKTRPIIETIDLTVVYKIGKMEVPALRGVNLAVNKGEFIAIMGPSGCGKSTLLHALGGLLQPTRGKILLDGADIARLSDGERTCHAPQKHRLRFSTLQPASYSYGERQYRTGQDEFTETAT